MTSLKPPNDYILFVEDQPDHVIITTQILKQYNFDNPVETVADGVLALAYLRDVETLPVLVLLDIRLPNMDGFTLLRAIRADDKLKELRVIALTVSNDPDEVKNIFAAGVNGFLIKPLDVLKLVDILPKIGKRMMIK